MTTKTYSPVKSVAGIFKKYANVDLKKKEKEGWGMAVIEKYATISKTA